MTLCIGMILLWVSQLIYAMQRWVYVSIEMIETARDARMRRAIDWT